MLDSPMEANIRKDNISLNETLQKKP